MKSSKLVCLPLLLIIIMAIVFSAILPTPVHAQTTSNPANLPQLDGSHDFDFIIGNWKAHVRRLPDRLNNLGRVRRYLEPQETSRQQFELRRV
jgi:hypothetical protein